MLKSVLISKRQIMDILEEDRDTQQAWLLQKFQNKTMGYLIYRAYSEAYGGYILFNKWLLEDMLEQPDDYGLGYSLLRGKHRTEAMPPVSQARLQPLC